jgi:hypothetical protein
LKYQLKSNEASELIAAIDIATERYKGLLQLCNMMDIDLYAITWKERIDILKQLRHMLAVGKAIDG